MDPIKLSLIVYLPLVVGQSCKGMHTVHLFLFVFQIDRDESIVKNCQLSSETI